MAVIGLAMPPDQKRSQRASTLDLSCGSVSIRIDDVMSNVPPLRNLRVGMLHVKLCSPPSTYLTRKQITLSKLDLPSSAAEEKMWKVMNRLMLILPL